MTNRREFLQSAVSAGALAAVGVRPLRFGSKLTDQTTASINDRRYWLSVLDKIASPVLENLSRGQLRRQMPVEAANPPDRAKYTHLEAFGRVLAGMGPWLAVKEVDADETAHQKRFHNLVLQSLDAATDLSSPDFMNFNKGAQPLVDAAFLAQGLMRASLLHKLDNKVRGNLVSALKSSRNIPPPPTNWVLFAAIVEAALHILGQQTVADRFEGGVRQMLTWYKGDGVYGDGDFFHFDYYNSFVIHPMLVDALAVLKEKNSEFEAVYAIELMRARRYAEIQERLICPDGSFPAVGRSITYRFGAFHALAQVVLLRQLPERLEPAQVRCALTAVIRKMIEAPCTFDDHGWLRIGFCGHQPSLAEGYISTGSLYLCTAALLPLGLAPSDAFWSSPPHPWTSQRIWSGGSLPPEHALS